MGIKIGQNLSRTTTLPLLILTKPKQRPKLHFSPPNFTESEISLKIFCSGFQALQFQNIWLKCTRNHFWSEPLININEQDCSVNVLTLRCHDHNCPVCPLTLPPSHSLNPFQLISRHLRLKTPLKQAFTGSKGQNC